MKVNQKILQRVITELKKGENGNLDFAGYNHRTKLYKYQNEVNVGVQMVFFNRSFDEAVSILKTEIELTK